ncbi:ribonuclease H-like domain-containing protein [Tanacetum coccineum]
MYNVVDISELKITIGHPNGTLATNIHVGNLKLTNNVVLYDVFVVPRYCVSLLSVNKLIRDSNMVVGFDENKCKSNVIMSFHVSKLLWHNRLGHSTDQVLYVIKNDLSISDNTFVPMCEVCQRAKAVWVYLVKTKDEVFDVFVSYIKMIHNQFDVKVKTIRFDNGLEFANKKRFNMFSDLGGNSFKFPQSPNDDGKDFLVEDGSLPHFDNSDSTQGRYQSDRHSATQIDDQKLTPVIRRFDRQSRPPVRLNYYVLNSKVKYGIEKYVNYSKLDSVNMCFATTLNKSVEPSFLSKVMSDPNWDEAMNNEIEALNRNNTSSGEIERYKARLVAKVFSQREGFDYDATLSLVVKMDKSKVCKLNKSLYGLKQALRQWNTKLTTALAEHGFGQSKFDYSLYTKHSGDKFIALLAYVDDIVITGNVDVGIKEFKLFLSTKFLIKDLGVLKYFLGIEVIVNDLGLCMSYRKYCLELLHEYGLLVARPTDIPLPENSILSFEETKDDKYLSDFTNYQKLVGKLIYLTNTRPSISYVVHCLSQHMHSPLQSHFKAALRLLRYLKGSPEVCLMLLVKLFSWIAANLIFHERTKHFELDVHFVREMVLAGIIKNMKDSLLVKIQGGRSIIQEEEMVKLISLGEDVKMLVLSVESSYSEEEQDQPVGNGRRISVWYDKWNEFGPLCQTITRRDMYDARFDNKATVADMILFGDVIVEVLKSSLLSKPDKGYLKRFKMEWTDTVSHMVVGHGKAIKCVVSKIVFGPVVGIGRNLIWVDNVDMEDDVDISALTIEQYIALIPDDIKPGIVNPKIGDDVEFEINANFMRELRRKLFAGTDDEDAYEHVRTVLEIVDLFHFPGVTHDAIMLRVFPITLKGRALRWKDRLPAGSITTWDLLKKEFIWRYCHPFITAKKLEEIHNFKQERDETLYYAWERYNDLLYQCLLHDLNCQQKVHIFYTGLDISTRKILDSNGFIPLMTPTQALESIQVMADHSHNWYDETTTRERINDDLDNIDAIHKSFKGEHLTKECSLKKENEAIKHSRYMESLEETIIKFCKDTIKK